MGGWGRRIELRLSFSSLMGKAVQFTTFPDTHWVWGSCGRFRNTLPRTCHLKGYQGKQGWGRENRQAPRRGHWRAGRGGHEASQTPGEIWPQKLHQRFLYKYTRSRQEARLGKVRGRGPQQHTDGQERRAGGQWRRRNVGGEEG